MVGKLLLVGAIALLVGGAGGYIANRENNESEANMPLVWGLGTEIIDSPKGPDGKPFDLLSTFAFSDEQFHCAIMTNEETFTMKTHAMGDAVIPQHAFSMSVDSATVDSVEKKADGTVEMRGTVHSITRVGEMYEDALVPFLVTATDGGVSPSSDKLKLTVFYNEKDSPMQYKIFGPEPHFGHGIIKGGITIGQ